MDRPDRPTGLQLYAEVQRYLSRVRCTQSQFSRASGITQQTLRSIELADLPLKRTVLAVRGFMDANPDRCPGTLSESGKWVRPTRGAALVTQRDGASSVEKARAASIAPARPSISGEAAARSDAARRDITPRQPVAAAPRDAVPSEIIATALVETPGDLIGRVCSAWPELWAGVVQAARREQQSPGAMLMTVISRGLEGMSA